MKTSKFLVIVLLGLLLFGLTACNLPSGSKPQPTSSFIYQATWTPQPGALTPSPTGMTAPTTIPGTTPTAPIVAKAYCGALTSLTYPGKTVAKVGIWYWVAEQYGIGHDDPMLSLKDSRYTKAYLEYIGTEKDGYDDGFNSVAYDNGDPVTFNFLLPCP